MRWHLLLAIPSSLALVTSGARAQLTVQGVRDLDFGVVVPGIQAVIAPTDPIKSGQFYLRVPAIGDRVQVRFDLPSQLVGPGGATMPISFANADGMAVGTAPSSPPLFFNPQSTTNLKMQTSTDANIWLGGRVSPTATQAVGSYSATVVLTVTVF